MPGKKEIERRYLENFFANGEFTQHINSIQESETPDFIVNAGGRIISIELTKLIVPGLKFIEEFRNAVIAFAHRKFKERHNKNLYCLIGLRNIQLGRKRSERQLQIEKYGLALFRRIEKIYLGNLNVQFDRTVEDINDPDDLATRLHVKASDDFEHWQSFGVHRVDSIDMEWLSERIKEKETKIKSYSQTFDENWLLLISNTGTKPSAHRFDFLDFSRIETSFEKVFVYKSIEDKIIVIV